MLSATSLTRMLVLLALLLGAAALPAAAQDVFINEVDAGQPGTDAAEFLELYNADDASVDLSDYVLVFFNGSDDLSYNAVDLDGITLGAGSYFVYCGDAVNVENCDLEEGAGTTNLIQNGADAVALVVGAAADYPNDTAIPTTGVADAIVYGMGDDDDAELLAGFGETVQYDDTDTESIQRIPSGSETIVLAAPSPGIAGDDDGGEEPVEMTIAEARAAGVGTTATFTGTVTRAMGDYAYVQDETAGLTIRQTEGAFYDAVADGTIAPGTQLQFTGTLSEYNQLMQINEGDLESYTVLGATDVPAAQSITLSEFLGNGEAYEAELIQVEDLYTVTATGTFEAGMNYDVSDAVETATLRVPGEEDSAVDGLPIPNGQFVFTGVVGQFDYDDPAAGYQLMAIAESDVDASEPSASLQIIHNSPDPIVEVVDVYINDQLAVDDLAFREATSFGEVPVGDLAVDIVLGSDADNSAPIFSDAYVIEEDETYQLIANGVLGSAFSDNPDGISTDFSLLAVTALEDGASMEDVSVRFVHGAPDAPAVDLFLDEELAADDVAFSDVTEYALITPGMYPLQVATADGETLLASFLLDLEDGEGMVATALLSGFLTPQDENFGNAPSFGVLAVLPTGDTVMLPALNEDGDALVFEAEEALLGDVDPDDGEPGAVWLTEDSNVSGEYSGNGFVALQKGTITFDITAVPDGEYLLAARYASPSGLKYEYVEVDGTLYGNSTECTESFAFPEATEWTEMELEDTETTTVTIDGTTNEIVIAACYGYTYFDAIALAPVEDDEEVMTIAEARAAGTGAEVTIEGTVTRAMGAFTYLQDETGAITIRQTSGEFYDAVADGTIAPGTQLQLTGVTSEYNGLYQINDADLADAEILGETDVPAPQVVTIQQILDDGEAYEAELLEVAELTTDAEGLFAAATNYDVVDATATGTLRVPGAGDSAVDGLTIPEEAFTFTGVLGEYQSTYQLLAIGAGDVEGAVDPGDEPEAMTIAEAREAGVGTEAILTGTVTRAMGDFTYVQDGTAGITIRQTSGAFYDAVADGTIAPGTQLEITGTTSAYQELYQINEGDLASYEVLGTTDVPEPQTVTLQELIENGEAYEAELIEVAGLTADATGTFEASSNYAVVDDVATGVIRVPNEEDTAVDGMAIPEQAFVFTGVVGQYSPDDPAAGYQLMAIAEGDIAIGSAIGGEPVVDETALQPVFPNPFQGAAHVAYTLDESARVRLVVFDVLGREVAVLADGQQAAGAHEATLEGSSLSNGVYIVRLQAGGVTTTQRVVLQK